MAAPKGHPRWGGKPKGYQAPAVKARAAGKAKALKLAEITAERTMLEVARMAFADRTAVWKDGKLLSMEQWPAEQKALLEGFEVVIKNAAAGDGHTDTVHKVHLAKKLGALELLAKHFGLVTDKVELSVAEPLLAKLDLVKARNRTKGET